MTERDNQRSKLYKAEREALMPLETNFQTIPTVERFLCKCCKRMTIIKRYGRTVDLERHPIEITDGRGTINALAHGTYKISLPAGYGSNWARTDRVALHELAHIIHNRMAWRNIGGTETTRLRGGASHGWQFAAVYLDLVRFCMGKEAADALKASFRKHRVRFRPKQKRKTTATPEQLAARMAAARAARTGDKIAAAFFAGN